MSHPSRPTSLQEVRLFDIPRKRNSDVALIELSDSDSDAPRPKKPRLDPQQKHPLLPPYITGQQTTVVPNPPVTMAPAATLNQLCATLSTGPDIDWDLTGDHISAWQQPLSVTDNKTAEMQMAAAPERFTVYPNLHPAFIVPSSSIYPGDTAEAAPSEVTLDAHPVHTESEGDGSNTENGQPNGHPSLQILNSAISTADSSPPVKYVSATEHL